MLTTITTLNDVETFAYQLVSEGLTGGFHPDDPFEDYTLSNGAPLYTVDEASLRNTLMGQCFDICEQAGVDAYETLGRITMKGTPFESMFDDDHEERYERFMIEVKLGIRDYSPNGVGSQVVREIIQAQYN